MNQTSKRIKRFLKLLTLLKQLLEGFQKEILTIILRIKNSYQFKAFADEQGDVPGWVLVVLMTTGLVTAIWAIAAPRLSEILKHSLDSMNSIG